MVFGSNPRLRQSGIWGTTQPGAEKRDPFSRGVSISGLENLQENLQETYEESVVHWFILSMINMMIYGAVTVSPNPIYVGGMSQDVFQSW